jgi:sarcosine oxidase gamma subunit
VGVKERDGLKERDRESALTVDLDVTYMEASALDVGHSDIAAEVGHIAEDVVSTLGACDEVADGFPVGVVRHVDLHIGQRLVTCGTEEARNRVLI